MKKKIRADRGEGADFNEQEYISHNEFSHISKLNLLIQHMNNIYLWYTTNTPRPLPPSPHAHI